jgi:hypothetical protein
LVGAQREFEERFRQWKMLEMNKKGAAQNEEVVLKRWQKSVLNLMKNFGNSYKSQNFLKSVKLRASLRTTTA